MTQPGNVPVMMKLELDAMVVMALVWQTKPPEKECLNSAAVLARKLVGAHQVMMPISCEQENTRSPAAAMPDTAPACTVLVLTQASCTVAPSTCEPTTDHTFTTPLEEPE